MSFRDGIELWGLLRVLENDGGVLEGLLGKVTIPTIWLLKTDYDGLPGFWKLKMQGITEEIKELGGYYTLKGTRREDPNDPT